MNSCLRRRAQGLWSTRTLVTGVSIAVAVTLLAFIQRVAQMLLAWPTGSTMHDLYWISNLVRGAVALLALFAVWRLLRWLTRSGEPPIPRPRLPGALGIMAGAEFFHAILLLVLWRVGFIMTESFILQIPWSVITALCWALFYLAAARTAGQTIRFMRLARENAIPSDGILNYTVRRLEAAGRTRSRYLPAAMLMTGTVVLLAGICELLFRMGPGSFATASASSNNFLQQTLEAFPHGVLLTAAGALAFFCPGRIFSGRATTIGFAVLLVIGGMFKLDDAAGVLLLLGGLMLAQISLHAH